MATQISPQGEGNPSSLKEYVLGYRAWKRGLDGLNDVPALISFKDNQVFNLVKTPASCAIEGPTPHPNCTCGYSAYHSLERLARELEPLGGLDSSNLVVGAVVGWGKMFISEDGWRSEFMKIVAIRKREGQTKSSLANVYGVPLIAANSLESYVLEFGEFAKPHSMGSTSEPNSVEAVGRGVEETRKSFWARWK